MSDEFQEGDNSCGWNTEALRKQTDLANFDFVYASFKTVVCVYQTAAYTYLVMYCIVGNVNFIHQIDFFTFSPNFSPAKLLSYMVYYSSC